MDIDAAKAVVMFFGESGSGKSTIVDAMDFVCNGQLGPIGSRQATPVHKFLPAIGSSPKDLQVEIEVNGNGCSARLSGTKAELSGDDSLRPFAHVLRRRDILRLIDARPQNRYQQLGPFIAVPGVEKSEAALRELLRTLDDDYNTATRDALKTEHDLSESWLQEDGPHGSATQWAEHLETQDRASLTSQADGLDAVLQANSSASSKISELDEAEAELREAEGAAEEATQARCAAEAAGQEAESALIELLDRAEGYVRAHLDEVACPVCLQPVDPRKLHDNLLRRKETGQDVLLAIGAAKKAAQESAAQKKVVARALKQVIKAHKTLAAAVANPDLQPEVGAAVDRACSSEAGSQDPAEDDRGQVDAARRLVAAIQGAQAALQGRRDDLRSSAGRLGSVARLLKNLNEDRSKANRLQELRRRVQAVLETVESRRKNFLEATLEPIAGRASEIYRQIHPGEPVGDIRLQLNPKRRASLDITANFETETGVPPEGYYSESHLDTLGICVFIALAEKASANGHRGILVLDDVLTSVDHPHVDGFVEVIHQVSANFEQVFLTTHSRYWYEAYRRGRGPARNIQLIDLGRWTIGHGIRSSVSPLPSDQIRNLLGAVTLDRQGVASKCGVLLESLLRHLALCFRLRLPTTKSGLNTLGELLDAAKPGLRRDLVVTHGGDDSVRPIVLRPVLDTLSAMSPFRNWVGAHDNPLGDEVPDSQIAEFGEKTLALSNALVCPKCGQLLGRRAGTHWTCSCRYARLEPLALGDQASPDEDVIP